MEFKDFIGIKDCSDLHEYCKQVVDAYKIFEQRGQVTDRQTERPASTSLDYSGSVLFLESHQETLNLAQQFSDYFWGSIYKEYAKKYPILNEFGHHTIYNFKVQKTAPGEGYHTWHTENCCLENCTRVLVWAVYLNDVEDGGETEFLYQATRVKPKTGRVVVWPAGLTHVHRGNQPLSGDKYLMTGWVVYKDERN